MIPNIPRRVRSKIHDALKVSPVVFLNGARQTGKSTLVQDMAAEIGGPGMPARYVTFDKPTQVAAATTAPEAFLTSGGTHLIIDEVQLVPEIFRSLKVVVDDLRRKNSRDANGRYLLTGSANVLALPALSDSLVGRMSVITLYPFCTAETIGGTKGNAIDRMMNMDFAGMDDRQQTINTAISRATFPEIFHKTHKERSIWFDGYITTILQRDVHAIADLEKMSVLPRLLQILATRAGNLLNDAEISRDAGLNSVTGKNYRNILKMMFLTFDVPPWHRNTGKRLVKASKGYIADTLMLCHILDMDFDQLDQNKPDLFGHILENYVATELMKLLSFSNTKAQLLHFRTSDGKEVDFVLEKSDGTLLGIEVKKTEAVNGADFKGLHALADLAGKDFTGGIVLYAGKDVVPFGHNLWAVPHHILWQ